MAQEPVKCAAETEVGELPAPEMKKTQDPIGLSFAQRKALFGGTGNAQVPVRNPAPSRRDVEVPSIFAGKKPDGVDSKDPSRLSIAERRSLFGQGVEKESPRPPLSSRQAKTPDKSKPEGGVEKLPAE